MKEKFISLLRSTNREGVEKVIEWLETSGFFEAPASTVFHGNHAGGLAEHSYQVALVANDLREMLVKRQPGLANQITRESVIICGLLHDVCKAEIYKKEEKFRKDKNGNWEKYYGYGVDYSGLPLGHGEKSVVRLLRLGLEMTEEEMLAIRWHMGAWNLPMNDSEAKGNINAAREKSPLVTLIMTADDLASHIFRV